MKSCFSKSSARLLLFCITLMMATIGAKAQSHAGLRLDSCVFSLIDSRDGLPENKIRYVYTMKDGRMVISSKGMVSVYDGYHFTPVVIIPHGSYPLPEYKWNAHIYTDFQGIVWAKAREAVVAFTSQKPYRVLDIDSLLHANGVNDSITNLFVDHDGRRWLTDVKGRLLLCRDQKEASVFLSDIRIGSDDELCELCTVGDSLFLFYHSGQMHQFSISTGKRLYSGNPFPASSAMQFRRGMTVKVVGKRIWICRNEDRRNHHNMLYSFDTTTGEWSSPILSHDLINTFHVLPNGEVLLATRYQLMHVTSEDMDRVDELTIDDYGQPVRHKADIYCFGSDSLGGLIIGGTERGLYYYNPHRLSLFSMTDYAFAHDTVPLYCDPLAGSIAQRLELKDVSCSVNDAINRRYFFGTRQGVVVTDDKGHLLTCIKDEDGLVGNNVQTLVLDKNGLLWVVTDKGVSSVRTLGTESLGVSTYSKLDGLQTRGEDFLNRKVFTDELGRIQLGYVGGTCYFHPDSISPNRYMNIVAWGKAPKKDKAQKPYGTIVLISCLLLLAGTFFVWKNRKRRTEKQSTSSEPTTQDSNQKATGGNRADSDEINSDPQLTSEESKKNTLERMMTRTSQIDIKPADEIFLEKLHQTVESHISDPNLSVATLSALLAMDRTALYRRMQQLTGISPSAYIHDIRMNMAARLLTEGKYSVTATAEKVGFTDVKYFSKVFKKHFGVAPNKYGEGS